VRYEFSTGEVIDVPPEKEKNMADVVEYVWKQGFDSGKAKTSTPSGAPDVESKHVKPPLGNKPEWLVREERVVELMEQLLEVREHRHTFPCPTVRELYNNIGYLLNNKKPAGYVEQYTTTPDPSGLNKKLGGFHLEGMDVVPNSAPEPKKCKICGEQTKMGICPNGNDYSTHHPDPRIRQMYEDLRNHKDILDGVKVDTPERGSLIRTTLSYDYLAGFRDGVREIKK